MWVFFWFPLLFVAGDDVLPCQSQGFYLNESWSSWRLLPYGNFSVENGCSYTFVYPNDTALCGQFYGREEYYQPWYDDAIGGIDAFGNIVNLVDYMDMVCLPPPWYSVFLPPKANADSNYPNGIIRLTSMDNCTPSTCAKHQLKKIDAFKKNKTVAIMPGMKPFIILENNNTDRITYNFTGDLSAVYVKSSNYYHSYEIPALAAGSFFLYNEAGQIIGTPVSWQNSVHKFQQLIVHEMAAGTPGPYSSAPGLLMVIPTADLDGIVNPKFIQPNYFMVPLIDAIHGETSVTIVDADSYSNYCVQYQLKYFTFSEDIEIIIHDGFPKQNISEGMIVLRLNASTLEPEYILSLGCTKTFRVLHGSVSFHVSDLDSYVLKNDTLKGFIKPELKSLKKNQKTQLNFPCKTHKKCKFIGEITFEDDSPADSKVVLNTKRNETTERLTLYPPGTTSFEAPDLYYLLLEFNKGAMHFEITEVDL